MDVARTRHYVRTPLPPASRSLLRTRNAALSAAVSMLMSVAAATPDHQASFRRIAGTSSATSERVRPNGGRCGSLSALRRRASQRFRDADILPSSAGCCSCRSSRCRRCALPHSLDCLEAGCGIVRDADGLEPAHAADRAPILLFADPFFCPNPNAHVKSEEDKSCEVNVCILPRRHDHEARGTYTTSFPPAPRSHIPSSIIARGAIRH
mmetsp:Transcript_10288/g.25451  ORF Transcript_10288/g.25451 Transcript_10288/m.25451 type:complete len:209 (+) Transcript_10288:196-822(+)